MRPIPFIAAEQLGCFTTRQAIQLGWTSDSLERAVRRGAFGRVRRGVYRTPAPSLSTAWDRRRDAHAVTAVAAALVTPGTRVSGSAAAIVHGLHLLSVPELACVSVVDRLTCSLPGVHLHRSRVQATLQFGSVECDVVERAVADIAREHGVTAGVVALDHALHIGLTDPAAMAAALLSMHGWPGTRRARRALELADERSESVLETRSRLAIERFCLPVPVPQQRLATAWGRFIGRGDFYWDAFGVVGEVDGAVKYDGTDGEALLKEKRRQEAFEEAGLIVVRWGKSDVDAFGSTADRLRRAFARGQARPVSERRWTLLSDRLALTTRAVG